MKFQKVYLSLILSFFCFIIGCSPQNKGSVQTEGYILEVNGNSILLAQNISSKRYLEVKNKSSNELLQADGLNLISLTVEESKNVKKGDKLKVWIEGPIAESYPEQAKAKKIELQNQ